MLLVAAEDEHMARERTLFKNRLDCRAQSGETTAQVRDAGGNLDVRAHRQGDHRVRPSSAARVHSGSAVPSMRTRACPRSISMIPDLVPLDLRRFPD
jgi:hypothetical protein